MLLAGCTLGMKPMSCQVIPADYFGDVSIRLDTGAIILSEVRIWPSGNANEVEIADARIKSSNFDVINGKINTLINPIDATQLIAVFLDKPLTGNYWFSKENIVAVSRFAPRQNGIVHSFHYFVDNRFTPLAEVSGSINSITTNGLNALAQALKPPVKPILSILIIADVDQFNLEQNGSKDQLQRKVKKYVRKNRWL